MKKSEAVEGDLIQIARLMLEKGFDIDEYLTERNK